MSEITFNSKNERAIRLDWFETFCVKKAHHMFKVALLSYGIKSNRGIKIIIQDRDFKSHGGYYNNTPFVRLNIRQYVDNHKTDYHELKSISSASAIGSIIDTESEVALLALISHQVAHAVQNYIKYMHMQHEKQLAKLGVDVLRFDKEHGEGWREIYTFLREKYVNHLIEDTETC